MQRVFEHTDRLSEFPLSGRTIKEIGRDNAREIIYGNYRIMYLVEREEVWVTGIVHGARNWNP